jgi:hypothetical protein
VRGGGGRGRGGATPVPRLATSGLHPPPTPFPALPLIAFVRLHNVVCFGCVVCSRWAGEHTGYWILGAGGWWLLVVVVVVVVVVGGGRGPRAARSQIAFCLLLFGFGALHLAH